MPISLSAKKSQRKSVKNRQENVAFKAKLKDATKAYTLKPTKEGLIKVQSLLDKASKRRIYHHNKSARLVAKFAKLLTQDAAPKAVVKKAAKKKPAKKISKKMS